MKILLVSDSDHMRKKLITHFGPQGSEIIQYWNPIKAMDNLDEVDPDVVLFNASDFPRHWKPMIVFARQHAPRESCLFILLTDRDFDVDEGAKAHHLGANGIVGADLDNEATLARLRDLVGRHKAVHESRGSRRLVPTSADRIAFLFTRPQDRRMVQGNVLDISLGGLRFKPRDKKTVADLERGQYIRAASLRVGDRIIPVGARLVSIGLSVGVEFVNLAQQDQEALAAYLDGHSERELQQAAGS